MMTRGMRYKEMRYQNLPADSLPTTNVRGAVRFDGGAVSAARAVARNVFNDARGGISKAQGGGVVVEEDETR